MPFSLQTQTTLVVYTIPRFAQHQRSTIAAGGMTRQVAQDRILLTPLRFCHAARHLHAHRREDAFFAVPAAAFGVRCAFVQSSHLHHVICGASSIRAAVNLSTGFQLWGFVSPDAVAGLWRRGEVGIEAWEAERRRGGRDSRY